MSSRKLFSIFSNSYTITFSSFDHTIPVPRFKLGDKEMFLLPDGNIADLLTESLVGGG